jgi:peptidoglycan/xylan/chitin deacetylase (PgdA/CDA1 family)
MLKTGVLSAYYHATLPWRAWRNRHARARGFAPVMILFYHRIADDRANDWTCRFSTFVRQIRWLKKHFDLISLEEAQARMRRPGNSRPAVSLTFDDGYAENCHQALPFLVDQRVPCTYFVCTRHILEGLPFPHDVARGRPLPPNTLDELRQLAAAGIEVGAHTRTHCDLGATFDDATLRDEVVAAGSDLAAALDRKIRYFAFPYGQYANLNDRVFALARAAGYEAICSAYGGYNFPGDDAFHLQRIHADDDMLRFKNWLTVDPRKLAARRYVLRRES